MSNEADTSKIRSIIEEGMLVKVGNGTTVRFWQDRWCEAGILMRSFLRLYAISLQKNSFISQMGNWNYESWVWNLRWRRTLYELENDAVATLQHQIEQIRPNREMTDGVLWKNSDIVGYPVKSIVEKMWESYDPILP